MKLDTNAGFNALAVLIPAIAIIQDMQEGTSKTILLGLVLLATAVTGFITKGDKTPIDKSEDIKDVLAKGREE
jgi:hypothetical protein